MAAATAASVFPGVSLTFRRHEVMSLTGNLNSNRIPSKAWRLAVSVDQVPATSTNSAPQKRRLDQLEKQEEETENVERPLVAAEGRRIGAKDYFEQARAFIKSDGGSPRWFSPLECASRLNNAPLLLFLPGLSVYFFNVLI
ncbi:hypothetical protein L6164_009092 [Bauhinia variegata]|uniref:Uncharacterized protein n=1 Tax=Bauhinia variegata TaxID=167791 RepID=A0ACB9PIL1_BAUVA|nr:hypothetical protein L6164_009092 [Bauhinia variegata]